jgi:hypothetical protein
MMITRCAALLALVIASACGSERTNSSSPPALLDTFVDGQWVLTVDRVWDGTSGNIVLPTDPLSDDNYRPVSQEPMYLVVLSDQGRTVSVGVTPFVGARAALSTERVLFTLSQGTFAGGRFVVWPGAETLQAELTLYGSGRPIVQSERGSLVPKP